MPGTDASRTDPVIGATLASAFTAACRVAGLEPPPGLRLLSTGSADPAALGDIAIEDPWDLGLAHQGLTAPAEQTRRGAWYTPRNVAADLVTTTVDGVGVTLDPACGGGVFLLAAADRLAALGADPTSVLTDYLVGIDLDPLAVAITEASLWWWGCRNGVDEVPRRLTVADALVDATWPPARFVVGNPPFLGQLKGQTVAAAADRDRLRARFGDTVGAYTDPSALFLLAGVDAVEAGGAVTLIQPQSMLAARDTERVRSRIDAAADLTDCWFDDGTTFSAAVDACAPTLRKRSDGHTGLRAAPAWASRLADHHGIPDPELCVATPSADAGPATRDLGSLASVHAGFRDEYYGLVGAVTEGGPGPRLITSGAIDPLAVLDRPVAFAKRRWNDPRIDVSSATERGARWVRTQSGPSVLVASQTRVLECVVDPVGDLVMGVPGLAIVPDRPDDVWHLAAMVSAPAASAWLLRRSVGTGMSSDALRPTAQLLGAIPLPGDATAWDDAAAMAREVSRSVGIDSAMWLAFGAAADASFGIADPDIVAWWWSRHPANPDVPRRQRR